MPEGVFTFRHVQDKATRELTRIARFAPASRGNPRDVGAGFFAAPPQCKNLSSGRSKATSSSGFRHFDCRTWQQTFLNVRSHELTGTIQPAVSQPLSGNWRAGPFAPNHQDLFESGPSAIVFSTRLEEGTNKRGRGLRLLPANER